MLKIHFYLKNARQDKQVVEDWMSKMDVLQDVRHITSNSYVLPYAEIKILPALESSKGARCDIAIMKEKEFVDILAMNERIIEGIKNTAFIGHSRLRSLSVNIDMIGNYGIEPLDFTRETLYHIHFMEKENETILKILQIFKALKG